jgi:hypothetical protein
MPKLRRSALLPFSSTSNRSCASTSAPPCGSRSTRFRQARLSSVHQHELAFLPGISHDLTDDDGPLWLKIDRLKRGSPPVPPEGIAPWLEVSPAPDRKPVLRGYLISTVSDEQRKALVEAGAAREEDCAQSPVTAKDGLPQWDVRLRLEDRPDLENEAHFWIEFSWLPWAIVERPIRRTLYFYQRFFEVAQLAEMGGGDKPFELVWGIGLARWRIDGQEIDLPLIERLIEIDLDESEGAAIKIRPRNLAATVNLRAFDEIGLRGVSLAYDSARRVMQTLDAEEGLTPYLRDSFEPILRACQSQIDPEGVYLPDMNTLPPDQAPPGPGDHLAVSDRWVIFGRKRSDSFLLADIESLKQSVSEAAGVGKLPGPCRTLVMGPDASTTNDWTPIGDRVGQIGGQAPAAAPEKTLGDLFFPKPFNDEQIEIVRRLKVSDGVVVQGPPGTGKTHTISNIICHAMATGQRVLIVSHGEPALAVLRDQLPESIRPLAISITATEREGFRQIESAIRILQSVVDTVRASQQLRLIVDIENLIVDLRAKLDATDREIEAFAHRQLIPALRGKRAAEIAEEIVTAAGRHGWLQDRPDDPSSESRPTDADMDALRGARIRLGDRLKHIDVVLPSVDDLPDGEIVAQWHEDLLRAKSFGEAAKRDPSIWIRLDSLQAADAAVAAADALHNLAVIQGAVQSKPWLSALANRAVNRVANDDIVDLVRAFAVDARPVAQQRQRYVAVPVELPEGFDAGPDVDAIVTKLAAGSRAFGLLAFRERARRPLVEAIKMQGRAPANASDWAHVRDYIAWRGQVSAIRVRWNALAQELGAPAFATARELADLVADIDAALIEALHAIDAVIVAVQPVMPDGLSPQALWFEPSRIEAIEQALRNAAASARLDAVRVEINRLGSQFDNRSGAPGAFAQDLLVEKVGRDGIPAEIVRALWNRLRTHLDDLRQHAGDFRIVSGITEAIGNAGAPDWACRLRTEPASDGTDTGIPVDWRDAWDWAVASVYLKRIDDKDRLRHLADERIRLDAELRKTFEKLVRERTFYQLAGSMTGQIRAALMMFATAVARAGKGAGKAASRYRRDARIAMSQCYGAIPCWIMPTWRVAEQLPGQVGTFDLVIMDEASQSDIKELPALLRGKKILVVGDDKQVSPTFAFIENAKIERLEHNYLQEQHYKTLLRLVAVRPRQGYVPRQARDAARALPLRRTHHPLLDGLLPGATRPLESARRARADRSAARRHIRSGRA